MTTIKSYSDLEQSRKLAEILPLESADMFYADLFIDNKHKYIVHLLESYGFKTFKDTNKRTSQKLNFIPCWSLAALLRVIPKQIEHFNILQIGINEKDFSIWYDYSECGVNPELPNITKECAVDACVAMIERLNELNLL